jgi:DNA-binding CsgD family transcriptional regulator
VLSSDIFTRLGANALLLAPDSTVLDLTSAARAMLDRALVLRLDGRRRLACMDPRGTSSLRRRVAAVSDGAFRAATVALPRADGLHPALASLSALPSPSAAGPAAAGSVVLAHIAEPAAHPSIGPDELRALFGLTPAEARVACSVLEVGGLTQAARRLEVSLNTVRMHLQRVFEKTGTRRQSQLVRLLLSYGTLHYLPG